MLSPTIEYHSNPPIDIFEPLDVGQRLVVVGESSKGPLYNPTIVYNRNVAESLFGYGPLIDRYQNILQVNEGANVVFVRIEKDNLDDAYRVLESYDFDLIYIDNFQFGESIQRIEDFIEFAQRKEEMGNLIHGFFELPIQADLQKIKNIIKSFTFEDLVDTYEKGKYLSIVSDQIAGHHSGAVYAGHILALEPGVSPVNKPLDVHLQTKWKKEELIYLQQIGVVAFRESFHHGVVCANSTCAVQTPDSAHKNIANFRIAQYLIQELSHALQKRIGYVQNFMQMERVYEIVENILMEYEEEGKIRQSDYHIAFSQEEGNIYIDILLVPIFTTEVIRAYSQVRIYW